VTMSCYELVTDQNGRRLLLLLGAVFFHARSCVFSERCSRREIGRLRDAINRMSPKPIRASM
jgi:hypothetical protein